MKLSVIVPCYNVAPYVDRAMRSISNQTLRDIEIICVDDKSTDGTLDVLKMWARADLRVRVIENKKNQGVAVARNRGIDAARGEYIGFVDPDDFVDEYFFERLVRCADTGNLDVACGQLRVFEVDGKIRIDPNRSMRDLRANKHNFKYHYTAIYRRDFLNSANIRYPKLMVCEDKVFETMAVCAMRTELGIVHGVYYNYCRRIDSLNSDIFNEKKLADAVKAMEYNINIYNSVSLSCDDYVCGAYRHFSFLYDELLHKNVKKVGDVAYAMCKLFRKMKFLEEMRKNNNGLFLALANGDVQGVVDVIQALRIYSKKCRLFGLFNFITISYNKVQCDIRLFGILIWRSKTVISGSGIKK
ncbi:MAG: glycosyltransferase [Alphaproteobacteria bacterium]|nr:glycosyltransferase [Alphaproteobacteria bacterium]